jgi:type I restriction enzyme S subunit
MHGNRQAKHPALPIINKGRFEQLPLRLPSTDEQREIVRRIESAFAWLDRVAGGHANASRLLPNLDQAILANAFRGELVLPDGQSDP